MSGAQQVMAIPRPAARPAETEGSRDGTAGGWLSLGFAAGFLAVFLAPPLAPYAFGPYPLMRWGDAIDMLTPLIALPLYWLVVNHGRPALPRWQVLAFLVVAAIWVEGQAMHLAANSIGHLVETGRAGTLAAFYDERLTHILWHGAALALSALATAGALERPPAASRGARALGVAAAAVYGFAFFLIAVEGATAVLAAAGGLLVTGLALRHGPRALLSRPTLAVFGAGYPVMLALLGIWFAYWGGSLPEFSALGIIK